MQRLSRFFLVMLLAASTASLAFAAGNDDDDNGGGAVYAMTNEATGNRVVVYRRAANGRLTQTGTFATGGLGSGQFEDSSNGLILTSRQRESSPNNFTGDDRFLIATNAASDSISVFRVHGQGLQLVDVEASNGAHPVSVTVSRGVLYVLNNSDAPFAPPPNCSPGGASANITGFTLSNDGELAPIPGSTRPLSGDPDSGCAQVSFTERGDVVVVTERNAGDNGVIDTYTVNDDGTVNGPILNNPTGIGPFGFNFTRTGFLLTAENYGGVTSPGQGHAAPYDVLRDGTLVPVGASVGNGGTDTCWLVLSGNDKYAYVTNFFSSSISSYRVAHDGSLTLRDPLADTTIGIGASDEAVSQNGRYLYARNSLQGTIVVFRIEADGRLTRKQEITGLPPNGIGLAAR